MTFLAPVALIGVLLLLIPIVAHLFKPRKMRRTPFSSLRWLKETHQRLSRRIQWHQWLLFLLRAGCILLLVGALARPLLGTRSTGKPVDRYLIVDASRSMSYQVPDQSTPLERAVELAAALMQQTQPGERTSVVLAEASPRLLAPLSIDASQHVTAVKAVKPGLADARLSGTLPLVASLLPREPERDVEIVFLTDNLQNRWRQAELRDFVKQAARPVRVKVIETRPATSANAWIAGARLFDFGPEHDRWLRVEAGCVGDNQTPRRVRLTGIANLADDAQEIVLKAGQVGRVDFKIPAGLTLAGQVAEVRLEPADALPSDDVFFLNLDHAGALPVLVVDPDAPGPDGRRVGLYLKTAMDALVRARKQSVRIDLRSAGTVSADDFRQAEVIFLAAVPELSDAALESLQARVRAGAGLAMFLGPQVKAAFYNQKLHRPNEPTECLLPLTLRTGSDGPFTEGKPGTLTHVRWTHPLLSPLRDPILSDFTHGRFGVYGVLEGSLGKNDIVLAQFDDAMPAIVERPVGKGRVLLFNTSADEEWSNLPKQPSFLVLLDRVLAYLATGNLQHGLVVGDMATMPLPGFSPGGEIRVTAPSGAALTPRWLNARDQSLLHLERLTEAGVYRITDPVGKTFAFTVNTDRADSSLSPMDAKVLEEWWAPARLEIQNAETVAQSLQQQPGQWPLWPWLAALAGVLLIAETIYVHRLCPRANPPLAA